MTSDGKRGFVSLWNASSVAELDLATDASCVSIAFAKPAHRFAGGFAPDRSFLDRSNTRSLLRSPTATNRGARHHFCQPPLLRFDQTFPAKDTAAAIPNTSPSLLTRKTLFSANAISDSVGVFDLTKLVFRADLHAAGFIPTEL